MNSGFQDVQISLQQADGELYPLFHRGDPDTVNLSLIPASEGQAEADIHFFHHSSGDAQPVKIGTLRFSDLPAEASVDMELQLDAVLGTTGLLTVTVRHAESGRVERLEMEVPDEDRYAVGSAGRLNWRNGPAGWVLGTLFVLVALAIVVFLTFRMTTWGREEPAPAPLASVGVPAERI